MTSRNIKERTSSRREILAKYALDLSKVTFTGLILGGIASYATGSFDVATKMILIGLIMTSVFLLLGYKLLK